MPIFKHDGSLFGVAGIDISLSELLQQAPAHTEQSYAFVINSQGGILEHPYLPQAHTISTDPVFLLIEYLEEAPHMADILEKMKRQHL